MAKVKKERELSAAEKHLLDQRQKLETAEKNHAAKPTAATEKAVADHKAEISKTAIIVNRERFVRVAGGRVKKARIAIKNLANVAAPRSYTYDESDVAKAETVLNDAVKFTIGKLRTALTKGAGAAKVEDDFTF